MCRIAMLCLHSSPVAKLGEGEAGGMSVYIRELARQLPGRGFPVDIFTRRTDPEAPMIVPLSEGARVIHLAGGPPEHVEKLQVLFHLSELAYNALRFAEEEHRHYQLVHSHYWLSGLAAGWLKKRWDVPHVAMFHTLAEVKNRSRLGEHEPRARIEGEAKIVASADRLVAPTFYERSQLVRLYGAIPSKIEVIPCGVDLERFRPVDKLAARRRLGITDRRVVLFVGRMDPLKGLDILLQAVAKLEDRDGLRVLVVGGSLNGDHALSRYQDQARALGIAGQVTFLGSLVQERLPSYYNAADVCVVPSYYESFSLVAVEALACGTPVIASRVGGLTGILRDGETGFLVPWRCPDPFSERLETLLGNDMLREHFGRAARKSVEKYAWQNVAVRIQEMYENLMHGRSHCCGRGAACSS